MYTCHAKLPRRRTTKPVLPCDLCLHTDLYYLVVATICWMCYILRGSLWFWKTESVCWNMERNGFAPRFLALCNLNFSSSYYRRSLSTSSMFWGDWRCTLQSHCRARFFALLLNTTTKDEVPCPNLQVHVTLDNGDASWLKLKMRCVTGLNCQVLTSFNRFLKPYCTSLREKSLWTLPSLKSLSSRWRRLVSWCRFSLTSKDDEIWASLEPCRNSVAFFLFLLLCLMLKPRTHSIWLECGQQASCYHISIAFLLQEFWI